MSGVRSRNGATRGTLTGAFPSATDPDSAYE